VAKKLQHWPTVEQVRAYHLRMERDPIRSMP
jgi:hypothetical protein